jgi:ketosteroid isomerase-like protein
MWNKHERKGKVDQPKGKVKQAVGPLTTRDRNALDEAQIRALIDDRVKAVRAKDVNGAIASLAPDILSFDVANPLQYVGSDRARKRTAEWFSSFQGPIGYEMHDLSIATGDGVAFSLSLNRVNATKTDGKRLDMWWRATVCYRKIDGKWMVTHEHSSVPFDEESGKASLDLKP